MNREQATSRGPDDQRPVHLGRADWPPVFSERSLRLGRGLNEAPCLCGACGLTFRFPGTGDLPLYESDRVISEL